MNLYKAIVLLQLDLNNPGSIDIMDLNKAQKLGIEALKALKRVRPTGYDDLDLLLPGETE